MQKQILAGKRILVVGDSMLDRYWFGDANRISPEAPVPVVRIVRSEDRLGGAANVALNIASLGAQASLLSFVGDDDAGTRISSLLSEAGIGSRLHVDDSVKTIVKLRIIARQQQLARIDFEELPKPEIVQSIVADFKSIIRNYDAVVFSDYGKGTLTNIEAMIAEGQSAGIPMLVDPKGADFDRYRGVTMITPNRAELALVTGAWKDETDLIAKATKLRHQINLTALLLTRSEEGMTLFTENEITTVPAQAREVFDVSGAGDTVIAVMATMLAAKVPFNDAVRIANRAGGIVVGKLGTASVTFDELFAENA